MIKQFYEKVLPSQGIYCVAGIKNKRTKQKFVEGLDELAGESDSFNEQGFDTYVALASFDGYSRRAEDAQYLRSFFVDLDVGDGKGYDSKADALRAL